MPDIDIYELAARAENMPSLMSFFLWGLGVLAVLGAFFYLQKILCELENKWLGFILPLISVLASLIIVGRTIIFSAPITAQVATFYEMVSDNAMGLFGLAVVLLVITNIPTIIFFIIYKNVRNKGQED